jgi:hypothetical protein
MKTPMIFAFGSWLEKQCEQLNLPALLMDNLDIQGESLCLSQTSAETTEKEYIDGSRKCKLEVDIIAQGLLENRHALIDYLTQLVYLFNSLSDYEIDNDYRILRASATAPSMQSRTENGYVRYAIAVSLTYKEL